MSEKLKRIIGLLVFVLVFYGVFSMFNSSAKNTYVSKEELNQMLPTAKSATLDENFLTLSLNNGRQISAYVDAKSLEQISKTIVIEPGNRDVKILFSLGALLMILAVCLSYVMKRARKNPEQNNSETRVNVSVLKAVKPEPRVNFDDVLGVHLAKAELIKQVNKIHKDAPMKALLFYGASGVGKTMLARALACAADCAFTYASASSFNELYVGMGAKRIRELFAAASAARPCIIFIDEIDALGASRGNLLNKESEHTLNELLVQMDGFATSKGILLIAATNRYDVLDPALLRRFSKRIEFNLPTEAERAEFVKAYKLSPALSLKQACALTSGFSGADFAAVAEELVGEQISEQAVLSAIATRRFGLAAASHFNEQIACSQAAIWTMAELLGAECYHVAGRSIWQLNLQESMSKAISEAQIYLSSVEATKLFFDDDYAFNKANKTAAANCLRAYLPIDDTGLRASSELANLLEQARSQASDLVKIHKDLIAARSSLLMQEAKEFNKVE